MRGCSNGEEVKRSHSKGSASAISKAQLTNSLADLNYFRSFTEDDHDIGRSEFGPKLNDRFAATSEHRARKGQSSTLNSWTIDA